MTSLIHPCQKRALIPLKFEEVFNYDTFFKVAQSYPHGPKLAQLTVPAAHFPKTLGGRSEVIMRRFLPFKGNKPPSSFF